MQQTTSGHTLKAFDQDIDRLRALISQMGGLAEHAIGEAMRCLIQRDTEGALRVVENDKKLDALEIETERRAVQLIALRAPMAGDLRDVVAALKISGVVERIGDYAKNIAKRVPQLEGASKIEPVSLLPEMARIATSMVHDVLDAFVQRDADVAVQVCKRDDAVDDAVERAPALGGRVAHPGQEGGHRRARVEAPHEARRHVQLALVRVGAAPLVDQRPHRLLEGGGEGAVVAIVDHELEHPRRGGPAWRRGRRCGG